MITTKYEFNDSVFAHDYKRWLEKDGFVPGHVIYVRTNKKRNKFYVGFSKNYNNRYNNNFKKNPWCIKNNIDRDYLILPIPKKKSNQLVEQYIYSAIANEKGKNNVRGGSITTCKLPENREIYEEKLVCHIFDVCFKCKQLGHYARNCIN